MTLHLLIAEDDTLLARKLERFFRRHVPVALAHDVSEARALFETRTAWCGAVFDVDLPDGSGLDLLDEFRRRESTAPALVLTGHCDRLLINHAQARDAQYAVKPVTSENLLAFAQLAASYQAPSRRGILGVTTELAAEQRLTPSEQRVLATSVCGARTRTEIARELGITEHTVKMHVRSLIEKCDGAEELADVVYDVWARFTRDGAGTKDPPPGG